MTCPECHGLGEVTASIVCRAGGRADTNVEHTCCRCMGSKVVPDEMAGWIETGKSMRADRISRRVSLRQEALRRGITPSALSRMEGGYERPTKPLDESWTPND